jgi:hypothetical protein
MGTIDKGGEIGRGAIVRVVMDTSPKMLQYNASAKRYAKIHFNPTLFGKNLVIWGTLTGGGRYTPIEHPDMQPQLREDLYGAMYWAMKTKPTPILMKDIYWRLRAISLWRYEKRKLS